MMTRDSLISAIKDLVDRLGGPLSEAGVEAVCVRTEGLLELSHGPDHRTTRRAVHLLGVMRKCALTGESVHPESEMLAGLLNAAWEDLRDGIVDPGSEVRLKTHGQLIEIALALLVGGSDAEMAAVMVAGAVLENHLRNLCRARNLASGPIGIAAPNNALKSAAVYKKAEARQIESWGDLRNAAAHHKVDEFQAALAEPMVTGVAAFMERHPK